MIVTYDNTKPIFADLSHYRLVAGEDELVAASRAAGVLAFKINEGTANDGTVQSNLEICERNNLIAVGYEYDHGSDGENFLAHFAPADNRIPCIDCEATDLTLDEAVAWVEKINSAFGRLPWVYGRGWFLTKPVQNTIIGQCPFWGAEYGTKLFVPGNIAPANVVAWQFTDGQHGPFGAPRVFPGVGACDINMLLQSVAAEPAAEKGTT